MKIVHPNQFPYNLGHKITTRFATDDDKEHLSAIYLKTLLRNYKRAVQSIDFDPRLVLLNEGSPQGTGEKLEPVVIVSSEERTYVGYVSFHITKLGNGQSAGEILQLRVAPEYQSRGHGTVLLREAELLLKQSGITHVFQWIPESALSARLFIRNHGYCRTDSVRIRHMNGNSYPDIKYEKQLPA